MPVRPYYSVRTRSRSPAFHTDGMFRRSRSREYPRSNLSPRYRRNHSPSPISRRQIGGGDYNRKLEETLPRKFRKPVNEHTPLNSDPNLLGYRTEVKNSPLNNTSHQMMSLSQRFVQYTIDGTSLYNRRSYRQSTNRNPFLILENNPKLPLATLLRQAKEISIVIDRTLPKDGGRSKTNEDAKLENLSIPRRPNEGIRPLFNRPEQRMYTKLEDEKEIIKRLLDYIGESPSEGTDRRKDKRAYHDSKRTRSPARFFGSRVDDDRRRPARAVDPLDTPRAGPYYLHDDRSSNKFNDRIPRINRNYRSGGHRSGYSRSPDKLYSSARNQSPRDHRSSIDDSRWAHDKFEELDKTATASPKSAPSAKPILWSRIDRELSQENDRGQKSSPTLLDGAGLPRSESESVKPVEIGALPAKSSRAEAENHCMDTEMDTRNVVVPGDES